MDITNVDPSLRGATEKSPKLNLENGVMRTLVASLSALMPGKRVDGVERRLVRAGGVKLRVYIPANPSGAGLLWIHGGGLVLGAAAMDDILCGETARATGVTIVSVDYRLAPKHPFPAAIDDCYVGWHWLRRHLGELGLDGERLAIGGQSAGGGLAASLVQRVHDEGGAIAAQWLFCPMIDDRTAADRSHDTTDHFIWNNRSNLVGWSSYLGDAVGADTLPAYAAASRREDLSRPAADLAVHLGHRAVLRRRHRLRAASRGRRRRHDAGGHLRCSARIRGMGARQRSRPRVWSRARRSGSASDSRPIHMNRRNAEPARRRFPPR